MLETHIAEIDLDTLVKRVREELERLGDKHPSLELGLHPEPDPEPGPEPGPRPDSASDPAPEPRPDSGPDAAPSPAADNAGRPCPEPLPCTPPGGQVFYKDLDAFWGPDFIEQAYRAILGRPPDLKGATHFGDALCSGRLTKAEVVLKLRRSPEGRSHAVRLRGLLPALVGAVWRKIPGIGKLFRRLDAFQHSMAAVPVEVLQAVQRRFNSYEQLVGHLREVVQRRLENYEQLADHLREVVHPRLQAHDGKLDALDAGLHGFREEVLRRLERLQEQVDHLLSKDLPGHLHNQAQAIARVRAALADHQRWHGTSVAGRTSPAATPTADRVGLHTPSQNTHTGHSVTEEPYPLLDALYTSLEDAFRGSTESIHERLRFYLPYVSRLPLDLVPVPVVDAGCGRGEWLELLQSEGIQAIGVDMNPLMVARCREKGLTAVEADAIQHLQGQAPGCVGAITAFQLIEHLELDQLIRFLDAAYQALAPGGMLLCETPNPENLMVSCYSFYLDPTHRHPIPPPVAVFLLESRGFCDVAVVRPPRAAGSHPEDEPDLPPLLRKLLFSEEDYAVIGYKP
ncbi:methyltransferase domain-containing protein [Desulfosoma caldarium]|uniref:O-antigen chain-terminating methyltransferase n=1 Tax=Desulfosoma caldarium TaxID=610254 RepID=A0A3N1VQ19_9BACT|nr:methyltransferase domain-containing protein [Desulfosoma caldarium]ROR03148.1 O-antigen chain-terminating methyltransferase [Desulfosoma caldarium]